MATVAGRPTFARKSQQIVSRPAHPLRALFSLAVPSRGHTHMGPHLYFNNTRMIVHFRLFVRAMKKHTHTHVSMMNSIFYDVSRQLLVIRTTRFDYALKFQVETLVKTGRQR